MRGGPSNSVLFNPLGFFTDQGTDCQGQPRFFEGPPFEVGSLSIRIDEVSNQPSEADKQSGEVLWTSGTGLDPSPAPENRVRGFGPRARSRARNRPLT